MPTVHYIGIDRSLALLVILESIHRNGYEVVSKPNLARFIKNSSLVHWYPEGRELPFTDPFKEINPWFDAIFNDDLPQLAEKGLAETLDRPKGVRLTHSGRLIAREIAGFPQYSRFDCEISRLIKEGRKGLFTHSPKLWHIMKSRSKHLYKDEVMVYDRLIGKTVHIGIAFEPDKIASYVDPKAVFSVIKERLERKEILRAPHDKKQLQFLREICETYDNAPLREKPLVEVCGHCRQEEENGGDKLNLFVEGEGIQVIAPEIPLSPARLDYHGLRVIGIPFLTQGILRLEATQIFDRGKYFPTNGRVL